MENKPLLNDKTSLLLWILMLVFIFLPENKVQGIWFYIIRLITLIIAFILFLNSYNPKEKKISSLLWKLKVFLLGNPKN